jgi:hypothetical protein
MKLKKNQNKIYRNQKFEDQIWYNQQNNMIFLNFSQLLESVFCPK